MWLVDSGATSSIISCEVYQRHLRHVPLEPAFLRLTAINGSNVPVMGKCTVTIRLNGRLYTHRFVVAGVDEPGILGRDFLRVNRCYWDWERNTLEVDGDVIKCRVPV